LWATLEPLAKYARGRPGRPTRDEIEKLAARLRAWYFKDGGLYLSADAREAYFHLQDALTAVVTSRRWAADGNPSDEIDPDTFESLRRIGSWLRTALTYDVGTRRPFSLAPAWQDEDADANPRAAEADRSAKRDAEQRAEGNSLCLGLIAPVAAPIMHPGSTWPTTRISPTASVS